ncbi:MAG: type IV toxin-antitoxin system AbiEi family antitoxin domain-containing protein [Gammaproteobacteria bacterium]|nr:type IV toxin-antitoxin system AbiEi family antitoxin domain-containing protein [Gammaproteobacteria bacterium]
MYKTNDNALKNLTSKPLFSAADARLAGIPPSRLSYYVKKKIIERVGRGVYRGVDATVDVDFQWEDLVLIAKSVSNGVVCLISALALYELTDEIPRTHWIAIPHATTAPKRSLTRFVRMRDISTGKTNMKLGGETIAIFNRERTIIDAFRYLTLEIGIKALRSAITQKKQKLDIRKLQQYAKKFRVNINPYIITVTTT